MLAILAAVMLVLPVFAGIAAAENEPITIRIAWWGDTVRHEKYNKIMDAFQAEYPWITVEREYGTWNDYWDKLATQVAGGNAPDVMGMHQQFAADYVARGVTLPLEQYIADGVIDVSKMTEGTLEGCKYDGKIVMLPMGITVSTVLLNKTLCDQLGVAIPAYG
ncbi:MAG: extracellular solute-binding protein, partial [Clostridia bacterium]|nr:extracellular solute-binding protein [Clostridia bacterium]